MRIPPVVLLAPFVVAPLLAETPSRIFLDAQLLTPLSSYYSKPGDGVEAAVVTPVCFESDAALERGATLRGFVKRVRRVGLGLAHETAGLELQFDELHLPDGSTYPIEAQLSAIENARERVDGRGIIHGIRATAAPSGRIGSHLLFAAWNHPAAAIPSLALETLLFRFPDPEIEYGVGTGFRVRVRLPAPWDNAGGCAQPESPLADAGEVDEVMAELPEWSYSKRQPQPMDRVNLLFVGAREHVERAFAAAGWTGSEPNSFGAGFRAIRAIAENREYAGGPMRTLLLDGAEPDLRLQKMLNTFDKRDHLRMWKRRQESDGAPVWAAAATRDLSTTFSLRHPFGFTHRIQNDVDLERDAVVRDLQFTGCVDAVHYASRPPARPGLEFRKGIRTDGRVAVLVVNACDAPRDHPDVPAFPEPPLATRMIRRATLTARNHFMRDNIVWRGGEALRIGWQALAAWEHGRRQRALAAVNTARSAVQ